MSPEIADIVMNPTVIASTVFAILFAATLFGMSLHGRLRDQHRSSETKDAVRVGMASVATMAALVLGLLVASTKESYDSERNEVIQLSAKIIYLNQVLNDYGNETAECRAILSRTARSAMTHMWPDLKLGRNVPEPDIGWSETLPSAIQKLTPANSAQETFKSQAANVAGDLGQMRWLLFEETESSISFPLLAIVVFWLALTFVSVGVFAPSNTIVVLAQMLAAFSVAGAIFLILELDQPFEGFISISNKPMVNALAHLSR